MNLATPLVLLLLVSVGGVALGGKFNKTLSPGDAAPDWKEIPAIDGKKYSLADFKDKDILVVVFTCNSCDYAQDVEDRLTRKGDGPLYNRFRLQPDQAYSNKMGLRWASLANRELPSAEASLTKSWQDWMTEDPAVFMQSQLDGLKVLFYMERERPIPVLLIDKNAFESFDRWQQSGAIRSGDPRLLIAMIVAVFHSLVTEAALVGVSVNEATLAFGEQCAWDMIRPPTQPPSSQPRRRSSRL